jgi:hypothetical protein
MGEIVVTLHMRCAIPWADRNGFQTLVRLRRARACWTTMISLDLYRTTSEGTEWVGTFVNLGVAKAKLTELAETIPGDYSIFDPSTGERPFYQDGP